MGMLRGVYSQHAGRVGRKHSGYSRHARRVDAKNDTARAKKARGKAMALNIHTYENSPEMRWRSSFKNSKEARTALRELLADSSQLKELKLELREQVRINDNLLRVIGHHELAIREYRHALGLCDAHEQCEACHEGY